MVVAQTSSMNGAEADAIGDQASPSVNSSFPASNKVYVQGRTPDILVPMREITLSPTRAHPRGPVLTDNAPFRVYDTSGPSSDPLIETTVQQGLPPLRLPWIQARGAYDEVNRSSKGLNASRPAGGAPWARSSHTAALCPPRHYHPRDGIYRHPREFGPGEFGYQSRGAILGRGDSASNHARIRAR